MNLSFVAPGERAYLEQARASRWRRGSACAWARRSVRVALRVLGRLVHCTCTHVGAVGFPRHLYVRGCSVRTLHVALVRS